MKSNDIAALPGPDTALAELLEILGLEEALAVLHAIVDVALHIREVCPRKDGAKGGDGAEEQEDEALAGVAVVGRVDAVDYEDSDDAAELASGGRDAVAGTAIARREDLGGDDEGECVCACEKGSVWFALD